MKDSDKLLDLLRRVNVTKSELGRRSSPSLTPTSVNRYLTWLDSGQLSDDQWRRLARGLERSGIDPNAIRPLTRERPAASSPEGIVELMDAFDDDRAQLEALLRLLDCENGERPMMRAIVLDRLKRLKP